MVSFMFIAFWILVVPLLLPGRTGKRVFFLRPRFAQISAGAVAVLALLLLLPNSVLPVAAISPANFAHNLLWILLIINVIGFLLGISVWLKTHPMAATVIASSLVVVGMWLERWNIVIPTVTHPMLVPYATYTPTLTEISITLASFAGFVLMFMIFFKLFPAISIWELAEGHEIQEAQIKLTVPQPENSGD